MAYELGRRRFLLVGAAALLAGCTPQPGASTGSASRPVTSSGPTPSALSTGPPTLPPVHPWHPDASDVEPSAKLAAVRDIEARGNRGRSALQVVDAQYGGLLSRTASVLVICRAWSRGPDGRVHVGGATYDVRVARSGHAWRVTAVHPSQPGPPTRLLSPEARHVLDSPRIDLPPAARADVRSGLVHGSVLVAMLTLSRRYRLGVSVVRSGHPRHVFGTARLSDHPRGRAFDTWRIDDQMVVDARTPRRLVVGFMEAAAGAGSYNVGGPYLIGSAPQYFSDQTHHDHVHAGFSR